MKVTVNWLKQYVDFNWSPAELGEQLTLLGLEVEGVVAVQADFEGVVVAEVLTRDKHPNADKLSVCRVSDGTGERQIVCGATNFKPGDKVPLILPGSSLPLKAGDKEPFVIQIGKIRGVESQGMMCSAKELGLPGGEDGLMILSAGAIPGESFGAYLGRPGSDVVLDLEITPNRPDLNSLIGIAREISAVTGNPLRLPTTPFIATGESELDEGDAPLEVRVEAPDLCPRYTARVVRGIRVGPSPEWLRVTLERVGLRSINNVVDVTNYVMLETGQPLHAFDFQSLANGVSGARSIVVRRAAPGEKLTTLDGQVRSLPSHALLIADAYRGLALAGIMGGQDSEIRPNTTEVLLESAYFEPTNIRRTCKAIDLRTDASYRFERGGDIEAVDFASRRAVSLLMELAGGNRVGRWVESYPKPAERRRVDLRYHRVNELLGTHLQSSEIEGYLANLGITPLPRSSSESPVVDAPSTRTFLVPSHRVDIKREVDLIEEVARLFGVNRLPTTAPRGAIGSHPFDSVFDEMVEARRILNGLGLDEAQGQTLIKGKAFETSSAPTQGSVSLANPLSQDMDILRTSLLPGLLDSVRHNLHQRNGDLRLFEIGRVFSLVDGQISESWRIGLALTGTRLPSFWEGPDRDSRCDGFDLKGIVEEFLEAFKIAAPTWVLDESRKDLFLEAAQIHLGEAIGLGMIGQLNPLLARQYDARDPVLLGELNLESILQCRSKETWARPLPSFPSVRRDLAVLVPESVSHEAILQVVRRLKPANLEAVELFDLFRGGPIPDGQKSMAYAFTYRASNRTLREEEVTTAQDGLMQALKDSLGATIRS